MKKFVSLLILILSALACARDSHAAGMLAPTNLLCEARTNPTGIGNPTPELSWQLQSLLSGPAYRGQMQTAYQIQVGSTSGASDLWDSGKVVSDQNIGIVYAGQPLTSGKLCYWQVRVYDNSNQVSAWSPPAQWSMGLLSTNDWSAQWIGYDAAYNPTPQQATNAALFNTSGLSWVDYPGESAQSSVEQTLLLKKIVLAASPSVTNAVFALYADNLCNVFVNGQAMTNAAMKWEATAQINVTAWLHAGTNILALQATNSDAQPASVIGRLVVQFASGSVSNYPVDTNWLAAQTAPTNWMQTNYDSSSWVAPAALSTTTWGTPSLNDIPRIPPAYLRKDFSIAKAITRATVYVTALGAYELHVNGQKVGNDLLTPGWTDFRKRVYYQTYDVTTMLHAGSNTVGAILGDGWYASVLAFKGQRQNYGGTPRFLSQLVIQFSDGTSQTVVSDNSWKASYGPILYGDLLLGSGYDARKEIPGWDTDSFDDSAWSPVVNGLSTAAVGYTNVTASVIALETNNILNFTANNATFGGDPAFGIAKTFQITYQINGGASQTQMFGENSMVNLGSAGQTLTIIQAFYGDASRFPGKGGLQVQAALTEPSRNLETLPAVKLTQPAPGCYTFDLGQNMVGWAQLNISGQMGDRITVRYGEMLNPDGTIYTANLRGATAADFYTFATNGTIIYQPRFTFHGFRYVELRGLSVPPTIDAVTGIVVHSDMPRTGYFSCSSPLVNQLYSNIIWGQMGNYFEVPTDCPQRDERMGWTGDTEFFVPTAAYDFNVQSFFRRHLFTLCEDSQESDGSFANVAPDLGAGSDAAAWGDAAWICPYAMYQAYGDTNVISDHYVAFKTYGMYLADNASNNVIHGLSGDFGDWLNLGGGATSTVIDTAFYAYYAQAMSEMAAAIGNTADAASYSQLHSNIVSAFAGFFNPDGTFTDGSSQTGYALAFTLNLVPANLRNAAAQKFAATITQFQNHLATGFIGTPRLLPALHAAGRDDLAYTLLLQQTYPSWLFPVLQGATTMWERWDGWTPTAGFETPTMNSFNHYSFGAVGQYLYDGVGGINSLSPAYKNILIQPVPGNGLTWANTSYDSVNGLISTAWTNTAGMFNLAVVIPPNTSAQVYIPTTNASAITESGVPAASSPGVTYLGLTNGSAVYQVGSGSYLWSSPYVIPIFPSLIETSTNQIGINLSTPFTPPWTVDTNGDLLLNQVPQTAVGNFSEEPYLGARNVDSLTQAGSLTIVNGGTPNRTTSPNYVTCGNGNGAGSTLVYALAGSINGYDLTNITVYGGWADNGRDQQAYTVYYSTVANSSNFIQLATVNYNPSVPNDTPSATIVSLSYSTGVLASNVAALKFDFTNPSSENGYCGYAAIAAFGTPSFLPLPALINPTPLAGQAGFAVNLNGLAPGLSYSLQSSTNLAASQWITETSFIASQSSVALTIPTSLPQKFYRLVGN